MQEINKTETCSRLNFRTKLIIGYTREETDWEVHKFPIQSTEEVAGVNETDRRTLGTDINYSSDSLSILAVSLRTRTRTDDVDTVSPNSATTGLYIVHPICRWAISAEIRCRLVHSRDSIDPVYWPPCYTHP